jgi:hypothetical protein
MIDIQTHLVLTEHRLADVRRAQEKAARQAPTLRALRHEQPARRPTHAGVGSLRRLRALLA